MRPGTDSRDSPQWLPFVVVVSVIIVVVTAPLLLHMLSPDDRGRIGVFERVTYEEEIGDDAVLAGMVAPEGWYWSEAPGEGSFTNDSGTVSVVSELLVDVQNPSEELERSVPVGARLIPPDPPVTREDGLEKYSVTYDLEAGAGTSRIAIVCATVENWDAALEENAHAEDESATDRTHDCLRIGIEMSTVGLNEADTRRINTELDDMIETVEVTR